MLPRSALYLLLARPGLWKGAGAKVWCHTSPSMAVGSKLTRSLKQLNSLYSQAFPDLTFITFVNGRPRSEIVNEMERKIGLPESPKPLPDSFDCSSTTVDPKLVRKKGSREWEEECDRDVNDVWRIARSRLRTLGVE